MQQTDHRSPPISVQGLEGVKVCVRAESTHSILALSPRQKRKKEVATDAPGEEASNFGVAATNGHHDFFVNRDETDGRAGGLCAPCIARRYTVRCRDMARLVDRFSILDCSTTKLLVPTRKTVVIETYRRGPSFRRNIPHPLGAMDRALKVDLGGVHAISLFPSLAATRERHTYSSPPSPTLLASTPERKGGSGAAVQHGRRKKKGGVLVASSVSAGNRMLVCVVGYVAHRRKVEGSGGTLQRPRQEQPRYCRGGVAIWHSTSISKCTRLFPALGRMGGGPPTSPDPTRNRRSGMPDISPACLSK